MTRAINPMSGPPKKAESVRKGHRKYEITELQIVQGGSDVVPELPNSSEMLAVTKKAWTDFWESPLKQTVVAESDLPAIVRLFQLRDEYERCRREFRKQRLVSGSQGQAVLNPLGGFMLATSKEIRSLEDRFGLSAVARLRLSVELNEASRSLDEMNRRLAEQDIEADGEDEIQDPRITAIETRAARTS